MCFGCRLSFFESAYLRLSTHFGHCGTSVPTVFCSSWRLSVKQLLPNQRRLFLLLEDCLLLSCHREPPLSVMCTSSFIFSKSSKTHTLSLFKQGKKGGLVTYNFVYTAFNLLTLLNVSTIKAIPCSKLTMLLECIRNLRSTIGAMIFCFCNNLNHEKFCQVLLQYKNTPSCRDGLSSAQKLCRYQVQDILPARHQSLMNGNTMQQWQINKYNQH